MKESQHINSIKLYNILHNYPISCDSTLGVKHLSNLKGSSPGAGGAILMSADVDDQPVVIKAFPIDCPFKYVKGMVKNNTSGIRDYGDYEPGTGLLFTDMFILKSITQNITTCYNVSVCDNAYDVPISLCTRNPINPKKSYPIPNDKKCSSTNHRDLSPLCGLNTSYKQIIKQSVFEVPSRSDTVRFMMVEKCLGDIQGLIEGLTRFEPKLDIADFDDLLYKMTLMVAHTLLLFDAILGGYSHKDLGTRNILYTWEPLSNSTNKNMYWRYNFPSGDTILSIDIPISTLIPKIWDFAFVRFGTADNYPQYYNYLPNPSVPGLNTITDDRENDMYVFLNDIITHLHNGGVYNTLYDKLDLNKIRLAHNNTAAIYEYFNQYPIPGNLVANDSHEILHTFPPNFNVFKNLNIDLKVI